MINLILFLGLIYCIFRISSLDEKVTELSKQRKSGSPDNSVNFTPTTLNQNLPVIEKGHISQRPLYAEHTNFEPTAGDNFIAWLKQDFLVKLGALLLLIGLSWFVGYAFANNWIGPVGRITLGVLFGVSIMLVGLKKMESARHQGGIFMVLGSAVVLLTVFAARELYGIFTPATALLLMFGTVVLIARVSVVYRSTNLATAGFLLAAIAPFMTNSPSTAALPLFLYLAVITLGSLWVLYRIKAVYLLLFSFFTVVLYSLPYLNPYTSADDSAVVLSFGFAFTAVYFLFNIISILKWTEEKFYSVYLLVAAGSGLFVAGLINSQVSAEWHSLSYIAWSLVFASGAFVVFARTNKVLPFYLYGAVSIGFLAAATAALFSGPVLTLVYTLEVTILVVLATRLIEDKAIASRICLLYAGPIILSLESIYLYGNNNYFSTNIFDANFFILLNLILCLSVAGYSLVEKGEKNTAGVLTILASGYLGALIWLVSHKVLPDDQATMVSLVIYTVIGLACYIKGRIDDIDFLRRAGGVVIALVVLRLLFIDVWQMEMTGRIITFLVVGVLLISTAFIKKLNINNN